jgi:ribose 5-phosphate isomerase B
MANVVIGADHGAYELKANIIKHLQTRGFSVKNMGVDSAESVDYPDMAEKTCKEFLTGNYEFGIVCCGTGIGISMSANKVDGIRCALPQNIFGSEMSKVHNNANFIAFGGRIEYQDSVNDMIDAFIDADFEGGRHQRRVDKIMGLES